MTRFKPLLAAKVEEEERREMRNTSLKDKFEEKEERVVYVESWPEKVFRIVLMIVSIVFVVVGVMALILPDTRTLLIEMLFKFIEEAMGAVKIG